MLFLGIDVGTGGTRAVLIDAAGKVVASQAADHAPFQSAFPGWAEQDPEDWWRAAQQSIRAVLAAAACTPADIAAIGRGFGCEAITVRAAGDLAAVRDWLAGPRDRPLLIDAKVTRERGSWWLEEAFRGH